MINSVRYNHSVVPVFGQFERDSVGHFLSSCRSDDSVENYCLPSIEEVTDDDAFYLVGADMPGME